MPDRTACRVMAPGVRRRKTEREDDPEAVVRAVVHARLLGLRILSLDAHVVVARPPAALSAVDVDTVAPATVERLRGLAFEGTRAPQQGVAPDLSQAVELLACGAETLARSRRRFAH